MIVVFQHLYPIFDYRERAAAQQERIRKAFAHSHYPYEIVAIQAQEEKRTLERLSQDACQGNAEYYAYVHLKGITHPGDENVVDWCELLEYFLIDCWRNWRARLESDADVVGVNLEKLPWPHYAGNFFAMKHSVAKTLMPVNQCENPEQWIGSSRKAGIVMASLHDSGTNHYQEPYPPQRYR